MTFQLVREFVLQSVVLWSILWVCGYPLYRTLLCANYTPTFLVPILGMFPLVCFSWIVLACGHGLATPLRYFITTALFFTLFLLLRNLLHKNQRTSALSRDNIAEFFIAIISGAMQLFFLRKHFGMHQLSVHTIYSIDAPQYANVVEHILRFGMGHGVAIDSPSMFLDYLAHVDVIGTFILLTLTKVFLHRDAWETLVPPLVAFWTMATLQLFRFLRRIFAVKRLPAAIIVMLSAYTPLHIYSLRNYFPSQMIAIAILLGTLTICLHWHPNAKNHNAKNSARLFLELATTVATLWYTYPFLALVAPIAGWTLAWIRRATPHWSSSKRTECISLTKRIFTLFLLTAIGAMLFANGRTYAGVLQAHSQGSDPAGWALSAILPHELVGISIDYLHVRTEIPIVIAATLLILAVGIRYTSKRLRLVLILLASALSSHLVIYQAFGFSYQQWKWAAIIAPLATACVLVGILEGMTKLRHYIYQRNVRILFPITSVTFPLVLVLVAMMFSVNNAALSKTQLMANKGANISDDFAQVLRDPMVRSLPTLSVLTNNWESMFVKSVRSDKNTYLFWGSYYPPQRVLEHTWVLQSLHMRTPVELASMSTIKERRINNTYVLREYAPSSRSASRAWIEVLHPRIVTTTSHGTIRFAVRIHNDTGMTLTKHAQSSFQLLAQGLPLAKGDTPSIFGKETLPPSWELQNGQTYDTFVDVRNDGQQVLSVQFCLANNSSSISADDDTRSEIHADREPECMSWREESLALMHQRAF